MLPRASQKIDHRQRLRLLRRLTGELASGTSANVVAIALVGEQHSLTKSDLIRRIADANPHLLHRDVERIVATIFDEIVEALARGDRVELRGFGAFSVRQRAARVGRNPRTGAEVDIPDKVVPHFKTGKDLRELLNGDQP